MLAEGKSSRSRTLVSDLQSIIRPRKSRSAVRRYLHRMTLAFGRQRVNDHGAVFDLLRLLQSRNQRTHVVAVNVTDVLKSKFVDERAGKNRRGDRVLHCLGCMMQTFTNGWNCEQRLFD